MFQNVFLIAYFVSLSYPNVFFFFLVRVRLAPLLSKSIYNINFNAYTQETQILFEIQGFYFFSNMISKRDVNPR